jgi:diguanylate cyclase (GGDEF)-like protein
MVQLFPGSSGAIAVLNVPRTGHDIAVQWGLLPPVDLVLAWGSIPSQGNSVIAPMVADDELLGVFALQDDPPPSEASPGVRSSEFQRRQQVASALAEQIALTIANLDLREALHAQAIRDPLTGLFNRRYMRETLDREIHRARRHMHPLSLMMLDIDHFKRYNDTFGHAAGDNALRLVGDCLLNAIRAEDLACRYGGEEFIVILPQCSLSQAVARAEQIRTRLRELYVERPGELPEVITASIGVAAFKETTEELDLLLKLVDEALYEAKHEGRDRVVAARPESSRALSFQPKDNTIGNARGSSPEIGR